MAKKKKVDKKMTDTEIRYESSSIANVPDHIFVKLSEIERRFLIAHLHDGLSLIDSWNAIHPGTRAKIQSRWVSASRMWKSIREKFGDDAEAFFEAAGLGRRKIVEVLSGCLDATRPVTRTETDKKGDTQSVIVDVADWHARIRALKELTILMGVRTEKVEHSGSVGVSMSEIHDALEEDKEK